MPTLAPHRPTSAPGSDPGGRSAVALPAFDPPPFRSHRLLRGGHAQTIAALYWPGTGPFLEPAPGVRAVRRSVELGDGDALALHDLVPPDWTPGDPVALLVHGLGGSAGSPYMVRIAAKLVDRGVRPFRLDHRTCGAGADLSRQPYHAGLSEDVRAAAWAIAGLCPGSPIGVVGFSMGGNMVLKALGEHADGGAGGEPLSDEELTDGGLDGPNRGTPRPDAAHPHALPDVPLRAVAVNPAVDLAACCDSLTGPVQRYYDRHFARHLTRHVANSPRVCPQAVAALLAARPRRIREFDEALTVPGWRFGSVDHYYERQSAAPLVERIDAPTLILTSEDDPLVPADVVRGLKLGPGVRTHVSEGGGHLGYVARAPRRGEAADPDRRWLDWRVVDWLTAPAPPADALRESPGDTPGDDVSGRLILPPR